MISRPVTLSWQRVTSFCVELSFICRAFDQIASSTHLKYLIWLDRGWNPKGEGACVSIILTLSRCNVENWPTVDNGTRVLFQRWIWSQKIVEFGSYDRSTRWMWTPLLHFWLSGHPSRICCMLEVRQRETTSFLLQFLVFSALSSSRRFSILLLFLVSHILHGLAVVIWTNLIMKATLSPDLINNWIGVLHVTTGEHLGIELTS